MKCDTNCQDLIQRYRKENTRRACKDNSNKLISSIWSTDRKGKRKLKIKKRGRLHHLFAIENSKLIFCYIPKNGCTVWKRILLTVNGDISSPSAETDDIHSLFRKKIKSLAKYNDKEALKRLKNYKKFLFVRDPMERLLSLFLDKAVQEGRLPFKENQFEDFLKFIIEQPFQPIQFAEHWAHAFQLCFPCDIDYDFIGRLETAERDTQYIFDNFIQHNRDRLTLHLKTNHSTNSSDFHKKERYFQQLSDDVLRKAVDRYHLDYVLFNYSKPYT